MERIKTSVIEFAIAAGIIIGLIAIVYGLWTFHRWTNYKLSYEDYVEQTVRSLVVPQCIISTTNETK